MNFKDFIKNEGLRKLAISKLSGASFSICIYLFNEILVGVHEIIASRKELSMMLGWTEKEISESLDELQYHNMIHVHESVGKPLLIRANLNVDHWNIPQTTNDNSPKKNHLGDASNLHSLVSIEQNSTSKGMKLIDVTVFDKPIPFPKTKNKKNNKNKETTGTSSLNDLGAFREKSEEIDAKIKSLAQNELDIIKHEKRLMSPDEELLLQILIQHHQPKKQLILALRSNLIYPNLKFFLANAKMLAGIPDDKKNK